jgi:hypothetical protein
MLKRRITVLLSVSIILLFSVPAVAQDAVTPTEVVAKVKNAAVYLAENGVSALGEFNDDDGPWAWKDTYVFVWDCETGAVAAHPDNSLIGFDIYEMFDMKGLCLGPLLCGAASQPNGEWVEYWWPKMGSNVSLRKITYMRSVPDQPYVVGAGIYEPTLSVDALNQMLKSLGK